MHLGRLAALLGLGGAALLLAPSALAQSNDSTADQGPEKTTDDESTATKGAVDDNARYEWLNAELKRVEVPTERWVNGWTAAFGWVALGQYAFAAAAPNAGLREMSIVGAINATLGLGAVLIAPNTLGGDARAKVESFDASTPLGAYERRRRAEYLLHATAAEESFYHGPIPLILATLSSGAGALILWKVYNQDIGAIATLASGVAVTGLQMITRPSAATAAWKHYVNRYHPSPGSQVPPDQVDMYLSFAVTPMGVAANLTF
jgi:hypothetical protein